MKKIATLLMVLGLPLALSTTEAEAGKRGKAKRHFTKMEKGAIKSNQTPQY